jgi:hypothetical protein
VRSASSRRLSQSTRAYRSRSRFGSVSPLRRRTPASGLPTRRGVRDKSEAAILEGLRAAAGEPSHGVGLAHRPSRLGILATYSGAKRMGEAVTVCGSSGVAMRRVVLPSPGCGICGWRRSGRARGLELGFSERRWCGQWRRGELPKVETRTSTWLRAASTRGRGACSGRSTAYRASPSPNEAQLLWYKCQWRTKMSRYRRLKMSHRAEGSSLSES